MTPGQKIMSLPTLELKSVGSIGNAYGRLQVAQAEGKFYWVIEDWDDYVFEEIPKSLYDELLKFEQGRVKDGN